MATTQLPGNLGHLDWSDWAYGLVSGAISGGANSVYAGFGSILVDSKDFNIYTLKLYLLMGITFGLSALMATMNYLRVKPLPERVTTTITETRSEHSTVLQGTGDGRTKETRSPHTTIVTEVVEKVPVIPGPPATTTTTVDPPKVTITDEQTDGKKP